MATATAEANVLLARRLLSAFQADGGAGLATLLHPDVRARPAIDGGPLLDGREAVLAWWAELARRGTELEARALDFETAGDCVIVRGYLRRRDDNGLAESQCFWLYEVCDGAVVRMESYPSRAAALAAAA